MTTIPFDTHKIVKELQEAGFDEPQAEAVVSAMGAAVVGNLATKADLQEFRYATQADMQEHRNATQADIRELRNEFKSDMQAMELRIMLRMGGLIVAGVGLIIALDKLV